MTGCRVRLSPQHLSLLSSLVFSLKWSLRRLQHSLFQTSSQFLSIYLQDAAASATSFECLRRRKKLTRKEMQKIEGASSQLASRPFKPPGRASFKPPIIYDFHTELLALVPTPLILGDNRSARLKPTPSLYFVYHLEGSINCYVILTLKVPFRECLYRNRSTFLFIQLVRNPHVRWGPNNDNCSQECLFYTSWCRNVIWGLGRKEVCFQHSHLHNWRDTCFAPGKREEYMVPGQ
ncbi:hypothetical protein TNCV_984041 [Trichonephila clavipes]|nr:hypothetical protein TNCV_984041 [Trichonephila clavipes]